MEFSVLNSGPIHLDKALYPDHCVSVAITAYREYLDIENTGGDNTVRVIQVTIKPPYLPQASTVRKEFLNYLLDVSIQHHLRSKGPP